MSQNGSAFFEVQSELLGGYQWATHLDLKLLSLAIRKSLPFIEIY